MEQEPAKFITQESTYQTTNETKSIEAINRFDVKLTITQNIN